MATRVTRHSIQVAVQEASAVRVTRHSIQVAIADTVDNVLRGPRRAGVILQRHPGTVPRG